MSSVGSVLYDICIIYTRLFIFKKVIKKWGTQPIILNS
ncbi:hypothetical protein ETAE_2293 [Edwardsiella piscicida]|uniref:Uncharacterized protein n=1 Tax=Edwardsiella piscicida TaxID=1263550 RepID=A0AAU8P452_EDWPI|nr:hypothetical protein ETAE_2293 [Edwardsiella tarda EIB202]